LGVERQRPIAGLRQHLEQARQRGLAITPNDACTPRCGIDLHVGHTGLRGQRALDRAHAARAANAVDEQQRLSVAAAEVAYRMPRDLGPLPDAMVDLRGYHVGSAWADGTFSSRSPMPGSESSGWP